MKKILFFMGLLVNVMVADNKTINTLACLYKEINPKEIFKEKDLEKLEHINNLLYADAHKDKFFLKALVLDYYYKANNIDNIYKKAYQVAHVTEKEQVGLYYAFYLQRVGMYKEAIKHLRGMEIISSKKLDIPKRIAYVYELFGEQKDVEINSYFNIKKVDFNDVGAEINECSKL